MDLVWCSLSIFDIPEFVTIYFPLRRCTADFRRQVSTHVEAFIKATEHTSMDRGGLRQATAGWVKETKIIEGEVANAFMLCLIWKDKQCEERLKIESAHWPVLVQFLKDKGALNEEGFHGKASQIPADCEAERIEISDDSFVGEETDVQIEDTRKRMSKVAKAFVESVLALREGNTSRFQISQTPSTRANSYAPTNQDHVESLNRSNSSALAAKPDPCITSLWDDDSDASSSASTPLLTPSSSTMSLSSLFDDTRSLSEVSGTWKSENDISSPPQSHKKFNEGNSSPDPNHISDKEGRAAILAQIIARRREYLEDENDDDACNYDTDPEHDAESEHQIHSASSRRPRIPPPLPQTQINARAAIDPTVSTSTNEQSPALTLPRWNPDLELANAKDRFWARRKRAADPACSPSSPSASSSERRFSTEKSVELKIDPLRSAGSGSEARGSAWWAYLQECFRAAALRGKDIEAGGDGGLVHVERAAGGKVVRGSVCW